MSLPRSQEARVHRITTARRPHTDDINARVRRYLVSMGIRTMCVLLAVLVNGPARWAFVAGAIVLPYVAVVRANAGWSRRDTLPTVRAPTVTQAAPGGVPARIPSPAETPSVMPGDPPNG